MLLYLFIYFFFSVHCLFLLGGDWDNIHLQDKHLFKFGARGSRWYDISNEDKHTFMHEKRKKERGGEVLRNF